MLQYPPWDLHKMLCYFLILYNPNNFHLKLLQELPQRLSKCDWSIHIIKKIWWVWNENCISSRANSRTVFKKSFRVRALQIMFLYRRQGVVSLDSSVLVLPLVEWSYLVNQLFILSKQSPFLGPAIVTWV